MKWLLIFALAASAFTAETRFDFTLSLLDASGRRVTLASNAGRPLIVLYFSLDCGKCRKALDTSRAFLGKKPGIDLVGVVSGSSQEKDYLARKPGEFGFPVYYDKFKALRDRYHLTLTPVTFFIDRTGRILQQREKYFEGSYGDLLRAYAAVLSGKAAEFAKSMQDRYYGAEICQPCHAAIYDTWKPTPHAAAYDPIAKKFFGRSGFRDGFATEVDPACLHCHTVGYNEGTGYDETLHPKHLLGVQCESCHTAAGPHDGRRNADTETTCIGCHDTKNDPLFRYADKLKKIKHPKGKI